MNFSRTLRLGTKGILLGLATACGTGSLLTVNYAPEFAGSPPHTVSIFGVFKDGRMDAEAWDEVAKQVSSAFDQGACNAAFGAELVTTGASLASAVDEYTRNYGVTDPLMIEFAPSANGDLILVLSIAGKPVLPPATGEPKTEVPLPMSKGGSRRGVAAGDPSTKEGYRAVEVSAALYSVPLRRTVATIAEQYGGKNTDEAVAKVEAELKQALPAAKCGGWEFAAHPVDDSKVRALPEP